jgi:oxygen-dependent protoporphyrinogen oxidase
MFSLDGGLRVLTDTLTSRLDGSILLNCPVQGIARADHSTDGGTDWHVDSAAGRETYSSLLFCSPAHRFPSLAADAELASEMQSFEQVYYPPIARLAFGFRRSQITHPLDGFGVLVPRKERLSILGVLFSSSMFENRAPRDHALLTVFAGGARNPELLHLGADQIALRALDDVRKLLGVTGMPVFSDVVKMERSIPQYNVGYGAVKELMARIEARSPGLYFAGNFRNGISVSDCITGGAAAAERVAGQLDASGSGSAADSAPFHEALSNEVSHA